MWTTALALVLVNIGAAVVIVEALGSRTFAPLWLGLVLTVLGVGAAAAAVTLWRRYLGELRRP